MNNFFGPPPNASNKAPIRSSPRSQGLKRDYKSPLVSPSQVRVSPQTKKPCFVTKITPNQLHQENSSNNPRRGPPRNAAKTTVVPKKKAISVPAPQIRLVKDDKSGTASKICIIQDASLVTITNRPEMAETDPGKEGATGDKDGEQLQATPLKLKSNSSQDIATFLVGFQQQMTTGLDFLRKKITDPVEGLESRVKTLEGHVITKNTGLKDRVEVLEVALKDPSFGLVTRLNTVEGTLKASSGGASGGADVGKTSTTQIVSMPSTGDSFQMRTLQQKVNQLENRLEESEFQQKVLLGWADTMFKDHTSLQRQVNFNTAKHHANEVIVGGIYESKKQDNKAAAIKFFQEKLGVVATHSDIVYARRIGKYGKQIDVEVEDEQGDVRLRKVQCPRHLVLKCTPQLRAELMAKKRSLTGQVDPKGFKYFVSSYLPDAFKAGHDKHRTELIDIYKKNEGITDPAHRKSARMVGADLVVNNKVVRGLVHPPSPGDVCKAKKEYPRELASLPLLKTRESTYSGSTFQGFVVRASKLLTVFLAYCKVRINIPNARHIMCAYNVADEVDSLDDGEHHGGLQIARALENSGSRNIAIFVTRQTGPDQIGNKRFEIIRTLVQELFQILRNSTSREPTDQAWPLGEEPTNFDFMATSLKTPTRGPTPTPTHTPLVASVLQNDTWQQAEEDETTEMDTLGS